MNYIVYHKDDKLAELKNDITNIINIDGAKSNYLASLKMFTVYNLSENASKQIQALNEDLKVVLEAPICMNKILK